MKFFLLSFLLFSFFSIPGFTQGPSSKISQGRISWDCDPKDLMPRDYEKSPSVPFKNVCYSQKITPASEANYFQALKEIFPDLQPSGKATTLKARRALSKDASPDETEMKKGEFDLSVDSAYYLLAEEAGKTQLVVFVTNDTNEGELATLALFQITPQFKLSDLIELDSAEHSSLLITPPQSAFFVKEGSLFFPTSSFHDNSGESFDSYTLFLTLSGKLQPVYEGPSFYGFRDPKKYSCKNVEGLEELKALATQHAGFLDISLKVYKGRTCENEPKVGGEKEIYKKVYPATLYWDPRRQKYMGGSKEFVKKGARP